MLLLQILVFNQLNVSGYINPYVYPLLIILLPFDVAGWLLLILAACLGLFIDIFTGTLGMHLFALVFMAGLRPSIAKILSLSKQEPGAYINIKQYALMLNGVLWVLMEMEFSTPIITSLINLNTLKERLLPINALCSVMNP